MPASIEKSNVCVRALLSGIKRELEWIERPLTLFRLSLFPSTQERKEERTMTPISLLRGLTAYEPGIDSKGSFKTREQQFHYGREKLSYSGKSVNFHGRKEKST